MSGSGRINSDRQAEIENINFDKNIEDNNDIKEILFFLERILRHLEIINAEVINEEKL